MSSAAQNSIAFPRLNDEQIAALSQLGERRVYSDGEVFFREGESGFPFFVVKRVASAVGEGAMTVHLVHRYLAGK